MTVLRLVILTTIIGFLFGMFTGWLFWHQQSPIKVQIIDDGGSKLKVETKVK